MEFGKKKNREIDLFDFTSFFGLDFFNFYFFRENLPTEKYNSLFWRIFASLFLQYRIWPVPRVDFLELEDFPVLLDFLDLLDSLLLLDFMDSLYFRITWHQLHLWPITFFHLQLHPWLVNYRPIIFLLKGHFSNNKKNISKAQRKLKLYLPPRTERDKKKIKRNNRKNRINVYMVFFLL